MLIVLKRLHQFVVPMMLGLSPIAAIAETTKLPISCPGCNLRGIDFNSAVMGDKYFIDSNFANADLRHADLSNMYMLTTNMEGADLRGAMVDENFYTKVMADQPYGICLNNTTLPNGNKVGASCEFR